MRRDQVIESLMIAGEGKETNLLWHAHRALRALPKKIDPALIRPALKRALTHGFSNFAEHWPDAYVDLLMAENAKAQNLEGVFLRQWVRAGEPLGPQIREAAVWLQQVQMVDASKKNRARLPGLIANQRAISALQTAVAACPAEAAHHLSVLAAEGSVESADAVLPIIDAAVHAKDSRLDGLVTYALPFAAGAMTGAIEPVRLAQTARAEGSAVSAVLGVGQRLFVLMSDAEQQVHVQLWLTLDSSKLRQANVYLRRLRGNSFQELLWEDGVVRTLTMPIEPPGSVAAIPAWLASLEKTFRFRWSHEPMVESSLRGMARKKALAWLMSALKPPE